MPRNGSGWWGSADAQVSIGWNECGVMVGRFI